MLAAGGLGVHIASTAQPSIAQQQPGSLQAEATCLPPAHLVRLRTPAGAVQGACPTPSVLAQNHEVWAAGEPAFLKYWLVGSATSVSSRALDSEEGFSQVGASVNLSGVGNGLLMRMLSVAGCCDTGFYVLRRPAKL